MTMTHDGGDQLFLIAETLAKDFSLFAERETAAIEDHVGGLLPSGEIKAILKQLSTLDVDSYVEQCVVPAEMSGRLGAKALIAQLGRPEEVEEDGPFYSALLLMDFPRDDGTIEPRRIGFIAQERGRSSGQWMPQHHRSAARRLEDWSKRQYPVVSFMDTVGADSGAEANADNQAHAISLLIAEMCNADVPTLGIILGLGYSGGAIPLAASNLILAVRDGVFNTINPKGLANIARKYNLSWQECAKLVGVSAYELYDQGNIDGIIDYVPGEEEKLDNLRTAIVTGVQSVEGSVARFVADNEYIVDHYRRALERYLEPKQSLISPEASFSLSMTRNPTDFTNVFGVAYRYLRCLGVRKRVRSTNIKQYGRLADAEIPRGELSGRQEREQKQEFLFWLQDPEKIIYDDGLAKAWKLYTDKKQELHDERGRLAQLIFGEPRKNYEEARVALHLAVGTYLYNRWKTAAVGNFSALLNHLQMPETTRLLLRVSDITEPRAFTEHLRDSSDPFVAYLRDSLSREGRKLLSPKTVDELSDSALRAALASELNLILGSRNMLEDVQVDQTLLDALRLPLAGLEREGKSETVRIGRALLVDAFPEYIQNRPYTSEPLPLSETTVLDLLLMEELREGFHRECLNILVFDALYDQVIQSLDTIAAEANEKRTLSQNAIERLLDQAVGRALRVLPRERLGFEHDETSSKRLREWLFDWLDRFTPNQRGAFLKSVEEWKRGGFPHIAEALLVVVTLFFERLVPSYAAGLRGTRKYDGRINPRNIGRRRDFWNQLTIAYHDLQIQNVLKAEKARRNTSVAAFREQFFDNFEELYGDLLSSDPVQFPGFRISIEEAIKKGQTPCGIVTGIGEFRTSGSALNCGVVISNVAFQAGAFDMASAEKFCHLLVVCAQRRLPVICFISSGGMQTKEGAGALFSMAAVNDRLTRFVRDLDLPVIMFGFGDCTGGAQASFVTHPLVQTYYLSGTNMPFAGQIVTPSNLPCRATLSNYLSLTKGAMQGLVKHPFQPALDDSLRIIDPDIPVPTETVCEVVERIMAGVITGPAPEVPSAASGERDLIQPVQRTLIHARGCTATKLVRVAQRQGIEVVLVQSDPDMESVAADLLGARDRLVPIGGNTSDESYLNGRSVVRVAELEAVDSLHPGIGFLSESSAFAELCRSHGINFIGPPVSAMETMGNKSNAISTARRLGVPVVPGSYGILTNEQNAAEVARQIGYPVLIKAVHGGGGKGIQVVEQAEEFVELFRQVRAEARAAFGNGDVYLEKFVTSLRHIEVQLLRDLHGNTRILGIRDCSVQRDKQKVVEESGSTILPGRLDTQVREYAAAIANEVGYVGAGTVEYIYDLRDDAVYFMEMNTRLQVEHPVTEFTSGIDIVAQQFRIAAGESIAELEVGTDEGYAIEVRLTAENMVVVAGKLSFRPNPGLITRWESPPMAGIEVIGAYDESKTVSPFYDSMIAQVVAHGSDRDDAADKLIAYLKAVRIEGICTNIPLLKRILADEVFRSGDYDTGYMDDFLARIDAQLLMDEIGESSGQVPGVVDVDALRIEGSDELKVLSPTTGIFYLTSSPFAPEYVSVGDMIGTRQTLCQIEAMKLFTPLTLSSCHGAQVPVYPDDQHYEITRINIANGQPVSAGDLLFVVRPHPVSRAAA